MPLLLQFRLLKSAKNVVFYTPLQSLYGKLNLTFLGSDGIKKYLSLLENSKKLTSKELLRLRISGSLEAGMNVIQFNLLIKVADDQETAQEVSNRHKIGHQNMHYTLMNQEKLLMKLWITTAVQVEVLVKGNMVQASAIHV